MNHWYLVGLDVFHVLRYFAPFAGVWLVLFGIEAEGKPQGFGDGVPFILFGSFLYIAAVGWWL